MERPRRSRPRAWRRRIASIDAHHPALHTPREQAHQQRSGASRGSRALRVGVVRHHYEDTQGCESMTQMVTRVTTLTRALLHGGAAGDAGVAKGRQIASNVGVQLAARAIGMVLGVVTVALTARTLGTAEYGVWTGVGNYVGLFGVLTSLGFTNAATLRMAAEPEREAEWLGALVGARTAMSGVVTLVCIASIPLVLTNTDHSHAVGYILSLATLSTGATSLMTVFQTRMRSGLAVSFTILQAILWLARGDRAGGVARIGRRVRPRQRAGHPDHLDPSDRGHPPARTHRMASRAAPVGAADAGCRTARRGQRDDHHLLPGRFGPAAADRRPQGSRHLWRGIWVPRPAAVPSRGDHGLVLPGSVHRL